MQNAMEQVTTPIVLRAAYGRKYQTKEQALDAWVAGKDFKIFQGPYCSIRDYSELLQEFCNIYIAYGDGKLLEV